MLIKSPRQFWELAANGQCGNTPRHWSSIEAYLREARTVEEVSIASRSDKLRFYHVRPKGARRLAMKYPGYRWDIYETPRLARQRRYRAFQGEVCLAERVLLWSHSHDPWGQDKRSGAFQEDRGLAAILRLRGGLGGELYEHLADVEAKYPGAVIEFSRFGWPLGIYKMPLIIWEVRHC